MQSPLRTQPRRAAKLARLALFGLLGAALLLSSLDFHSTGAQHSALDGSHVVFPEARHPAQPSHLEASDEQLVPACPACLLKLQTLGGSLPRPRAAVRPLPEERRFSTLSRASSSRSSASTRSRAPPLA
jgi:hypothetical protein